MKISTAEVFARVAVISSAKKSVLISSLSIFIPSMCSFDLRDEAKFQLPQQINKVTKGRLVQFLNSPLSTRPHIGAEPGRAKRRVQDNLHAHAQNKPIKNY